LFKLDIYYSFFYRFFKNIAIILTLSSMKINIGKIEILFWQS
jgi:hypothetical protein